MSGRQSIKDLNKTLRKAKRDDEKAETLCSIGDYYRDKGDNDNAKKAYKEAIEYDHGALYDATFAYRALSEIYATEGDGRNALDYSHLFRERSEQVNSPGQIQLSLHVTAWVYEKLWVEKGADKERTEYLEKALKWALDSDEYIKKNGHLIDKNRQEYETGGKSKERKANLYRLICGIAANLNKRDLAEKYWSRAFQLAENDKMLEYQLYLARIDFSWLNSIDTARKLVNKAPAKVKGLAMLELSQATFYSGDMDGAYHLLLQACSKYRKQMKKEDVELLNERLIFFYRYFFHLMTAENANLARRERRANYETLADLLCEYSHDKKEVKTMALKFYGKMLKLSETGRERHPALLSLAVTNSEVGEFAVSLDYYLQLLDVEQELGMPQGHVAETRGRIVIVKCNGRLLSHLKSTELEKEFDDVIKALSASKIKLKEDMNQAMAEYFLGDPKADAYQAEAERFKAMPACESVDDEEGREDDNEGEGGERKELIPRKKAEILRECYDEADKLTSTEQLKKDINWVNIHGESRLHLAAKANDQDEVRELIKLGYNVNKTDYGGWTPLSEAVSFGILANVLILLAAGAKIDCVSKEKLLDEEASESKAGAHVTPLMEACESGQLDIARVLFERGASVKMVNEDKWTAVDFLRTHMDALDPADKAVELAEAKKLVEDMETKQQNLGMDIRVGPPPARRRLSGLNGLRSRKQTRPNSKCDRPSSPGKRMYQNVMNNLGSRTRSKRAPGESCGVESDDEADSVDESVNGEEDGSQSPIGDRRRPEAWDNDSDLLGDVDGDDVGQSSRWSQRQKRSSTGRKSSFDGPQSHTQSAGRSSGGAGRAGSNKAYQTQRPFGSVNGGRSSNQQNDDDVIFVDDDMGSSSGAGARKRSSAHSSGAGPTKRGRRSGSASKENRGRRVIINDSDDDFDSPMATPPARDRRSASNCQTPPTSGSFNQSRDRDTPTSSSSSVNMLMTTLSYQQPDGSKLCNNKMIPFPRTALISDVYSRVRSELPVHQQEFQLLLPDGTELDDKAPLEMIPKSSLSLQLTCRLRPANAVNTFRGLVAKDHSSTVPSFVVDSICRQLGAFDMNSILDCSRIELDGLPKERNLMLKAVNDTHLPVKSLNMDQSALSLSDVPLLSSLLSSSDCHHWSARASALTDECLKKLCESVTSSPLSLTSLDLSNCEFVDGVALTSLLSLTPTLARLTLQMLDIDSGINELTDAISALTSLTNLDLSYNGWLQGNSVQSILEKCQNLSSIRMVGLNLEGLDFASISLPLLRHLSLSGCTISDWTSLLRFITLASSALLESVDLSSTEISHEHISQLMANRQTKPLTLTLIGCHRLTVSSLLSEILSPLIDSSLHPSPSLLFRFSRPVANDIRQRTVHHTKFLLSD